MIAVRIASWNLGHQLRASDVSDQIFEVLHQHAPGVVVFTEVMPKNGGERLRRQFAELGMKMCDYAAGQRVVIASKTEILPGDIQAIDCTPATRPNFRQIFLPEYDLHVVGMRVPMFDGYPGKRREYWEWLERSSHDWASRRLVAIGDLNADPKRARTTAGAVMVRMASRGWRISDPNEPWSYPPRVIDGLTMGEGSRVDHALLSPELELVSCAYITKWRGEAIVARRKPRLADHALLLVTIADK